MNRVERSDNSLHFACHHKPGYLSRKTSACSLEFKPPTLLGILCPLLSQVGERSCGGWWVRPSMLSCSYLLKDGICLLFSPATGERLSPGNLRRKQEWLSQFRRLRRPIPRRPCLWRAFYLCPDVNNCVGNHLRHQLLWPGWGSSPQQFGGERSWLLDYSNEPIPSQSRRHLVSPALSPHTLPYFHSSWNPFSCHMAKALGVLFTIVSSIIICFTLIFFLLEHVISESPVLKPCVLNPLVKVVPATLEAAGL